MPKMLVKTTSNTLEIPSKWQERFLIKRIDAEDIEISLETRNAIVQRMQVGERFVQIGKITLMLNSIRSIEPKWGERNIPPKPKPRYEYIIINQQAVSVMVNQEEINEWEKFFGKEGYGN